MTTTLNSTPRNAINWFEIPVRDIQKAKALYGALLDIKLEISDFGGIPHAVFPHGEKTVSGALVVDPKRTPGASGPLIYLDATDGLARCLARGVEAGAKVIQPATPIGPHGTIAVFEDLDGNVIGLHEEPAR
jgi:predicted enzyme related to lactoylglutathione lyase